MERDLRVAARACDLVERAIVIELDARHLTVNHGAFGGVDGRGQVPGVVGHFLEHEVERMGGALRVEDLDSGRHGSSVGPGRGHGKAMIAPGHRALVPGGVADAQAQVGWARLVGFEHQVAAAIDAGRGAGERAPLMAVTTSPRVVVPLTLRVVFTVPPIRVCAADDNRVTALIGRRNSVEAVEERGSRRGGASRRERSAGGEYSGRRPRRGCIQVAL